MELDPTTTIGGAVAAVGSLTTLTIIWRTRRAMLKEALKDVSPEKRAEVIKAMRGVLWGRDIEIGPFRRKSPPDDAAAANDTS